MVVEQVQHYIPHVIQPWDVDVPQMSTVQNARLQHKHLQATIDDDSIDNLKIV